MTPGDEHLQEGIAAYKQGRKQEASRLIKQALQLNPQNEQAWLWLSALVHTDEQRRICLNRVIALNPANEAARRGLQKLTTKPTPPPRPSSPLTPPLAPTYQPSIAPTLTEEKPPPPKQKKMPTPLQLIFGLTIALLIIIFTAYILTSPSFASYIQLDQIIRTPPPALTFEQETAVISAVYENIAATNAEDIDRYMASLHTFSRDYQSTRQIIEKLYRDYDLTATLSSIEVIRYSPTEARVRFILETRKRSGPDFRDNRINGTFILRPENGRWKLYDQIVNNIEYFN